MLRNAPEVSARPLFNDTINSQVRRASTPTVQQGLSKGGVSIPLDSLGALRHQVDLDHESNYRMNVQDPYNSSSPNSTELKMSNSQNSSMPSSATQTSFGIQNVISSNGVPDLSAMMFPSANPFAYPNQPMTTLENQNFMNHENPRNSNVYNMSAPSTSAAYGTLDPQVYGSMPAYMMQDQQPGFSMQNLDPQMNASHANPVGTTMGIQGIEASAWRQQQQQAQAQRMNLDQLLGEDWAL